MFLFLLLLLLHKTMTRWLDPTRTFFWGSDSQRSIIYVRGKCIDVTDRQGAVGGKRLWKRMVRVWGGVFICNAPMEKMRYAAIL